MTANILMKNMTLKYVSMLQPIFKNVNVNIRENVFLTPLQVTRSFGDDVLRLTAIEIAFSVGMMVGGAIIASWGGFPIKCIQ